MNASQGTELSSCPGRDAVTVGCSSGAYAGANRRTSADFRPEPRSARASGIARNEITTTIAQDRTIQRRRERRLRATRRWRGTRPEWVSGVELGLNAVMQCQTSRPPVLVPATHRDTPFREKDYVRDPPA